MSWETKDDYCGLSAAGKIVCKSATMNRTGTYLEKAGSDGAIAATKYFGEVSAPSNEYAVENTAELSVKLGAITTVDGRKYALQSVSVKTTAGGEPTLSATAQEVEDGATQGGANFFSVPSFTLDKDEIAQTLFSAFTLKDGELTDCSAEISCTVGTTKVNGTVVASDVTMGKVVVSATVGQYGETAPAVTPSGGWEMSAPLTCTDPDSDFPSWTFSVERTLEKTDVSAA